MLSKLNFKITSNKSPQADAANVQVWWSTIEQNCEADFNQNQLNFSQLINLGKQEDGQIHYSLVILHMPNLAQPRLFWATLFL